MILLRAHEAPTQIADFLAAIRCCCVYGPLHHALLDFGAEASLRLAVELVIGNFLHALVAEPLFFFDYAFLLRFAFYAILEDLVVDFLVEGATYFARG